MNENRAARKSFGYHFLWYIPLCLGVLFWIIIPNIVADSNVIQILLHRWSWGVLISPSAVLFIGALIATVLMPIWLLLFIPFFFDPANDFYRKRYFLAVLIPIAIVFLMFILWTIMWGSMPLTFDAQHNGHIRLIPFTPWPDQPWGTF